jgi:hypothetical protein
MFVVRAITYAALFIGLVLVYVPARLLSWSGIVRPATKVARFYEPLSYKYSGRGEVIPISLEDNTPFVVAKITRPKTVEGKFLIDTLRLDEDWAEKLHNLIYP